jgi:translocation and assembly module TamA
MFLIQTFLTLFHFFSLPSYRSLSLRALRVILCYLAKPLRALRVFFALFCVSSYIALFCIPSYSYGNEPYTVIFSGAPSEQITEQLKAISQLVLLKERPPATLTGLRRRADNDLPDFIKLLNSHGYFAAGARVRINPDQIPAEVSVEITPGKLFTLTKVSLFGVDSHSTAVLEELDQSQLSFPYNDIALPAKIIDAESKILELLAEKGYPFAAITKKEPLANNSQATLSLNYYISTGPKAFFGHVTITGNKTVKEELIRKKITWHEGEVFSKRQVAKTQQTLESLALFITIDISYADSVVEDNRLPMTIEVAEGKMRTVSAGISYMNDPGFKVKNFFEHFGVNAAWQHRNMRGLGEKLSFETTIGQRYYYGSAKYLQPAFFRPKEDLIYEFEASHDITSGYTESYQAISTTLDRKISRQLRFSYGLMLKQLHSTHSESHGRFLLFKVPLQVHWSNAADLLDPVRGHAVAYRFIPTYQLLHPNFTYWINYFVYSFYLPLFLPEEKLVFAVKTSFGSLFGAKRRTVPAPERFYAGSDTLLRGYRYKTVSPLDHHHRPIGGLSMLVLSSELRFRPKEALGYVLFYEVGNVYSTIFPNLRDKQMHSTGVGLRYPTPIGPIRADLGFPLKRRKKIDSAFQLYFSIGQTF